MTAKMSRGTVLPAQPTAVQVVTSLRVINLQPPQNEYSYRLSTLNWTYTINNK